MTNAKRIKEVIKAILIFLVGIIMIIDPKSGLPLSALILSVYLVLYGIRHLLFYSTMARHMVGGKSILYQGVLLLDFGFLILTLINSYRQYVAFYMLILYLFTGVVDILRSREMKKNLAPGWKPKMLIGLIEMISALAAMVFGMIPQLEFIVVYLFAAGLFYSACIRIISAFRKNKIIYIQ